MIIRYIYKHIDKQVEKFTVHNINIIGRGNFWNCKLYDKANLNHLDKA